MDAKQVADTIIEQLGKGFRLMTGAHNFSYSKEGALTFEFKGCRRFNACTIALNPMDLYDVAFYSISLKRGETNREEHKGIYADQLHSLFRESTGLETRFPRIVGLV